MRTRNLVDRYDATTWYWNSRFYRGVYRQSYVSLFKGLERRGWLEQSGSHLRVLDCGIGTGLLTASLIDAVDRDFKLSGIDISRGMLTQASYQLRSRSAGCHVMRADICHLPFRDDEMDLVMAALVLEHVQTPCGALREMVRVASPNATVLLIATKVAAPDWPFRFWFKYQPFAKDCLVHWMKNAGIRNLCMERLAGPGRPFARAYIGSVRSKH